MAADDELSLDGAFPEDLRCHALLEAQWMTLRDIRLTALKDSPASFLSTYEKELVFDEARWRSEFSRGDWILVEAGRQAVGLVGAVTGWDVSADDRYLEYLWITPEMRHANVATNLINAVVQRLKATGIHTVWLWILDGNEPARKLYEKCGFATTGKRQPLPNSTICEERMRMELSRPRTGVEKQ